MKNSLLFIGILMSSYTIFAQADVSIYVNSTTLLTDNEEQLDEIDISDVPSYGCEGLEPSDFYGKQVTKEDLVSFNKMITKWIVDKHVAFNPEGLLLGMTDYNGLAAKSDLSIQEMQESSAFAQFFGTIETIDVASKIKLIDELIAIAVPYDSIPLPIGFDGNEYPIYDVKDVDAYGNVITYTAYDYVTEVSKFISFIEKWTFNKKGKLVKEIKAANLNQSGRAGYIVDQGTKKAELLYKNVSYNVMFDRETQKESYYAENTIGRPDYDLFIAQLMHYVRNNKYDLYKVPDEDIILGKYDNRIEGFIKDRSQKISWQQFVDSSICSKYVKGCALCTAIIYDSLPPAIGIDENGYPLYDTKDLDKWDNPKIYPAYDVTCMTSTDVAGMRFFEDWYMAKNGLGIIKEVRAIQFLVRSANFSGGTRSYYAYNLIMATK